MRQGKMKSTKQLSSEAAFGPKIGRGEVDAYSPGNYVAQFPVRHKSGMQKTLQTAMAIDFSAGKMGTSLPRSERIAQLEERALTGLTGILVNQTRKLRAQNQAEVKNGKKSKTKAK